MKKILVLFFAFVSVNSFSKGVSYLEKIPSSTIFPKIEIFEGKVVSVYYFEKDRQSSIYEVFPPAAFDIRIKFDRGLRFQFDVYPGSTTTLNKSSDNSVLGVGGKVELFIGDLARDYYGSNGYVGVGTGIKYKSNKVNFNSDIKNVTTFTVPLYTTLRYGYRINEFLKPYIKGNVGFAFSNQSWDNRSKQKIGLYAGGYLGLDIDLFCFEFGVERTGVGKSFTVGIGYLLPF